jgi:hypothetical protein
VSDPICFLSHLSNPLSYPNGSVSFCIEREDGAHFDLSVSADQFGDMFTFLLGLAGAIPATPLQPGPHTLPTANVNRLGIGTSPDPDKQALVAQIGGLSLLLLVPNSDLQQFGRELAQKVQALSASGKPQ